MGAGSDDPLREMIQACAGQGKVVTPSPFFFPIIEAAKERAAW